MSAEQARDLTALSFECDDETEDGAAPIDALCHGFARDRFHIRGIHLDVIADTPCSLCGH